LLQRVGGGASLAAPHPSKATTLRESRMVRAKQKSPVGTPVPDVECNDCPFCGAKGVAELYPNKRDGVPSGRCTNKDCRATYAVDTKTKPGTWNRFRAANAAYREESGATPKPKPRAKPKPKAEPHSKRKPKPRAKPKRRVNIDDLTDV